MYFNIGFVLCILGLIYVIYKTIRNRNIISPQIFLMSSLLLYLYIPAVILDSPYKLDEDYNFVIMIGVIGALFASNFFSYNVLQKKENYKYEPKIKKIKIVVIIYISYLIWSIIKLIIQYGSINAIFTRNRVLEALENITTISSVEAILLEGGKIFFYIYLAYIYENKKKIAFYLLFLLPMIHHRFTAITRYDFIAMLGSLIVFRMDEKLYLKKEKKKKIKIIKIASIGFMVSYFSLIFMRVANMTRMGKKIENLNFSLINLFNSLMANDSLYYDFFYKLYSSFKSGMIEYEKGLSWIWYPFLTLIPRTFWIEKPYTAFSARMTDRLYYNLTSGNPVVTFSILGEGYAQFGVVGIFIVSFVFLGARWINIWQLKKIKYSNLCIIIILFSMLTYGRSEAPIFFSMIDAIWIFIICKFFSFKKNGGKN